MDRPLKLVGETPVAAPAAARPAATRPRPLPALSIAAVVALAAGVATAVGVEGGRDSVEPREAARRALALSLSEGSDAPEVRALVLELRTRLGRRPLDSRSRVVYSALLLDLSRRLDDTRAAAFHARRAATLAPVTVPIVRLAVLTLARTGDAANACTWVRAMFGYDGRAGAALLAEIEPLVPPDTLEQGLPDDPDAWFAWATHLRRSARYAEAYATNLAAHRRWPDHLPTLRFVAARAVDDGDWDRLATLLEGIAEHPTGQQVAPLLAYRARLAAARGDTELAEREIAAALALDGESNLLRILAGEAYEALGDYDRARRSWNRALFEMPDGDPTSRRVLLTRLARLEDRFGRPSAALRLWESILESEPAHEEASRRVRALRGL